MPCVRYRILQVEILQCKLQITYLKHSCNIMPDLYDEHVWLTRSGSNVGKESIDSINSK